jgi:hypothetical protein
MANPVFLHIGLPKSGTTFLQTRMWNNRALLRKRGFLYPGRERMDHFHASQVVREVRSIPRGKDDAWDRLVREITAWDGAGLISHEFFCIASAEQARAAVARFGGADVHVVVTARDYVRQFAAVWQEALKMGTAGSLDAFMEQTLRKRPNRPWGWPSQDLPAVLDRWRQAVPLERIHLVTVPPPGAPADLLWERWCSALGLDDRGFDMDEARANESLGAAQAALLQRVVPHLTAPLEPGSARHRWLRHYFGHEVLAPQRGERFGLKDEHATELRKLALQAVDDIAAVGYPVIGDLADLVPPEEQPARPHPDHVPDREVVEVAARAIEQMIRDVMTASDGRRRWRRQALRLQRRTLPGRVAAARRALQLPLPELRERLRSRVGRR